MSQQTRSQVSPLPKTSFTPVQSNLLQRKCGCGQSASLTGQCSECQRKKLAPERGLTDLANESEAPPVVHEVLRSSSKKIQPKLKIGQPNDKYEQEADRIADQVMRMPISNLQCQVDKDKGELLQAKSLVKQRVGDNVSEAPPIVQEVLRSPGQPLDEPTRQFMESRFDHDFRQVRIHTDGKAVESTLAVDAQAFTVGQHVVFGSNQYSPYSEHGRWLLSHELTHVMQQSKSTSYQQKFSPSLSAYRESLINVPSNSAPSQLQRVCDPEEIGSIGGCVGEGGQDVANFGYSSNNLFRFYVNCDDFRPGEETRLREFISTISEDETIEVHGFASEEGDETFNINLSCARAHRASAIVMESGLSNIKLYEHGATLGERIDRRSVVITTESASEASENEPTSESASEASENEPTSGKVCGPDITKHLATVLHNIRVFPAGVANCAALVTPPFAVEAWDINQLHDDTSWLASHKCSRGQFGGLCNNTVQVADGCYNINPLNYVVFGAMMKSCGHPKASGGDNEAKVLAL